MPVAPQAVLAGLRVVFEPEARAWDSLPAQPKREFQRKVRTLTGNYQLLTIAPWLLSGENPDLWRLVSHKLLRLAVPFALGAALVANLFLGGVFFHVTLALQTAFYLVGLLGWVPVHMGTLSRIADSVRAFLILNTAALMAFRNFVAEKWEVWV